MRLAKIKHDEELPENPSGECRAIERPDENGKFDELMIDGRCFIHAEMMDNRTLWIGIYDADNTVKERVSMWVRADARKLSINVFND